MMEDAQAALVAAFAAGRVAGAPAPVAHITTHLSHLFMSGDRAFKLKRAVKLPFVDFSTCAQRQKACVAELSANRAMARALYIEARALTAGPSGFSIGGEGEVVDWVVVMRRFEQAQQFDHLAAAHALSRDLVERAAETIVAAHQQAKVNRRAGYAAHYREVIRGLQRTETHGAERLGLKAGAPVLYERLDSELTRMGALIERRRRQGKVRRGHGDLHLRNLCVFEGRPMAFDALEFDDRLATTDVLYDLAFLLMDLRRVGLIGQANAVLNRYWDASCEDEEALALLPFFTSLRAAVRMAVAVEAGELVEAQIYRALGMALLERSSGSVLAIGGLSGSGKSAVAQAIAPSLPGPAGARILRSDVLRKRLLGLKREERAMAAAYAPERRADIYRLLAEKARLALQADACIIADATFQDSAMRDAIVAAAGGAGLRCYWLTAPLAVRVERVSARANDVSDADAAVAASQHEPQDLSASWRRIDATRSVAVIANDILQDVHGLD